MFQCILIPLLALLHPYYVSMTEINYNSQGHTLEVSVRIFADDFEKAIRKSYSGKVDLLNDSQKAISSRLVSEYISRHLLIKTAGKDIALHFNGFESREGSIWSFLEADNLTLPESLEINNTVLYDYQTLQVNFIRCRALSVDETQKLNYPDSLLTIKLK